MSGKKLSFFERERLARRLYGFSDVRPQETHKSLYQHARKLNYGLLDEQLGRLPEEEATAILAFKPTDAMRTADIATMYPSGSNLNYIDNSDTFQAMIEDLGEQTEIAVDLEGHIGYTFRGMTTLVQISTSKRDYVVCPFATRDDIMKKLKNIFQNPKIAKVFHAIDNDFLALRRDFNIAVIGAVDTKEAWKFLTGTDQAIGFDKMLKEVGLEHHQPCKAPKEVAQLADWRLRPLPPPLLAYARHDTHALIRAWNIIKQRLNCNGVDQAFSLTRDLILKLRYKPPKYEDPLVGLTKLDIKNIDDRLKFIDLHRWRLQLAKMVDCSPTKLLTNQNLAELVRTPPATPVDMQNQLDRMFPRFMRGYQGLQFFKIMDEGMRAETYNPKCHNCFLLSHQAWACWKAKDKTAWKRYMERPENAMFRMKQKERRNKKSQENRRLRNQH